jgi:hypothetical protein
MCVSVSKNESNFASFYQQNKTVVDFHHFRILLFSFNWPYQKTYNLIVNKNIFLATPLTNTINNVMYNNWTLNRQYPMPALKPKFFFKVCNTGNFFIYILVCDSGHLYSVKLLLRNNKYTTYNKWNIFML